MSTPIIDTQFLEYWSKLSVVEKESLLQVAKNYVELKDSRTSISHFSKMLILKEREDYLQGGGKLLLQIFRLIRYYGEGSGDLINTIYA